MEHRHESGRAAFDLGDVDDIGLGQGRLGASLVGVVDLGDDRRALRDRRIAKRQAGWSTQMHLSHRILLVPLDLGSQKVLAWDALAANIADVELNHRMSPGA